MDRLRDYPEPMASRHLDNELDPAAVEAMMQAIENRYGIAQRWFRHKAGLLGPRPARAGRPVRAARRRPPGALRRGARRRRHGVPRLLGRRSPASRGAFFDERRVDAEPRPGKRGGAFCASVAQDAEPYVLLNHTDTLRDLMTIAHELGHGMHFVYSSRRQTALSSHAPLALCEVPSTFAELIVFDRMLETEQDPATRAALVRGELESGFATVFRQT